MESLPRLPPNAKLTTTTLCAKVFQLVIVQVSFAAGNLSKLPTMAVCASSAPNRAEYMYNNSNNIDCIRIEDDHDGGGGHGAAIYQVGFKVMVLSVVIIVVANQKQQFR